MTGTALRITPPQTVTPRLRNMDLMTEVARWTNLCDNFTYARMALPGAEPCVVLTAVLAEATNLGLTRIAQSCAHTGYHPLAWWTASWHLSEENCGRALARIVDAQHDQPLSAAFESAAVSSSDGQHFALAGRGEVAGTVNPHKGSSLAVSFYTFTSGHYTLPHQGHLGDRGEAAYVLDALLGSEVEIAVHHTDGCRISDQLRTRD